MSVRAKGEEKGKSGGNGNESRAVVQLNYDSHYCIHTGEDNEAQEQESPSSPNGLVAQAPPKLAAIDASYAREAKIAQRTIKAQDKLIAELKNDIEKQNALIEEQRNDAKQQSLRMEHLDHEIASIKQVNRSLMEDNESYQILLHEKTISGEFIMNPIMQVIKNDMEGSGGDPKGLYIRWRKKNDAA